MLDTQNSMMGGGALLAIAIYAGTSMYVTGPLITQRMIERSGWHQSCERRVKDEIQSTGSASAVIPQIDCNSLLRNLDPALRRMVEMVGARVACQMMDAKRQQQEALQRLKNQRLRAMASRAGSRCQCAVSALIDKRRVSVALHAGSARLITPPVMKNLNGELSAALHAPHCAVISQGAPASRGEAS